jgi:uncharacterized cupin superfamily protein
MVDSLAVPALIHWDDVTAHRLEVGEMCGHWQALGPAAGSVGIGLNRVRIEPNRRSTPVHRHGAEEEIFFILEGSGLSWMDERTHEVRAGDTLVHRPRAEAHTLIAGDEGLTALAFGTDMHIEAGYLPRAEVVWLPPTWAEAGKGRHPWEREKRAGPLWIPDPVPRPPNIIAFDDVPEVERSHGDVERHQRLLSDAAGSVSVGMRHFRVPEGKLAVPPHCHSAEEELFVVLAGQGWLLLGDEEHAVRPGHVVARPPGTGVAHSFRAGPGGLEYLTYGTREPNDIGYYPRSNKVSFRGVGLIARVERLDYWDGEPE